MTTIYDYSAGKQIYLYPSKKEALITTIKGRPTPEENEVNQMLNDLLKDMKDIKRPSRSLGHKLIDGVDCIGYEFGHGDQKSRSWADAKTGKLVRSEIDNFLEPPFSSLQGIYRLVWSDFKIDEKVDPRCSASSRPRVQGHPESLGISISARLPRSWRQLSFALMLRTWMANFLLSWRMKGYRSTRISKRKVC